MKLEVLISTMNRNDYSLLDEMNLQSDAIVVNQCDKNEIIEFDYKGHHIKWLSLKERGVGLSRNTALSRATGDIVLFADDDVRYVDGYEEMILKEFEKHSDVDFMAFNILSLNPDRPEYVIKEVKKLHWFNCLKYGACRFALRRNKMNKVNLFFSLLFGGGAVYQAGEDNLFMQQALQKGLRVIANPVTIGSALQEETTWFKGYDEKYFFDRGALFAGMFGNKAWFPLLLMTLKNRSLSKTLSFSEQLALGKKGMRDYLKTDKVGYQK